MLLPAEASQNQMVTTFFHLDDLQEWLDDLM
jgi:hypothetical protein